jgi:hypothetical protein
VAETPSPHATRSEIAQSSGDEGACPSPKQAGGKKPDQLDPCHAPQLSGQLIVPFVHVVCISPRRHLELPNFVHVIFTCVEPGTSN